MKLVDIECRQIMLEGITLNASLTLANHHQILALMFQLEANPTHFEIEPQRGMILQGQKKFVKIRLKPELRKEAQRIQRQHSFLIVRATYYCEYNRKLLTKNNLKGWNQISRQYDEQRLPIKLSFEAEVEKLKRSLKREGLLKHSPRQNSFEKFRESSTKRAKDPKLNEDLEFLFRNEEYARQEKMRRPASKADRQTNKVHWQESREVPVRGLPEPLSQDRPTIGKSVYVTKGSRQRSVEIVILAVIAALSLAVGETIGSFFKH